MFSLNVPVPGEVHRLVNDLHPALYGFDEIRRHHSIVAKRLGDGDYHRLEDRAIEALTGTAPFAARVTGLDAFEDPVAGPGPVCYLAVESPGLRSLHRRLVASLGAVEDLEGDDYVPHVTLARGGSPGDAERVAAREIDPIDWTVTELEFRDARRGERVRTVSLPR